MHGKRLKREPHWFWLLQMCDMCDFVDVDAFYIQYDWDIGLQGYDLWYVCLRWDRSVINDEAVSPRLWLRDVNCEVRGVLQRVCLLSGQTSRGSPRGESPESHLASSGHPSSIHLIALAKAVYVLFWMNWSKKLKSIKIGWFWIRGCDFSFALLNN